MLGSRRPALIAVAIVVLIAASTLAACGNGDDEQSRPTTGEGIYAANCLTCHGADGQGGVGPRLAGIVATRYPNIDDQIAVVTNGRGGMPSFESRLSAREIRKVVEFERAQLGQ